MKKIVALLLILVLSAAMLVGCDDTAIGEYEYPDYQPVVVDEIDLNLYIIGGNPDGKAITTVKREITAYTKAKFQVNLNVNYFTEAQYSDAVSADLSDSTASVDIVLINSEAMFEELCAANKLVNLNDAFASKEYGMLNAKIATPLLQASKYIAQDGSENILCVPNNRVLGNYTYLLIDRKEAHTHGYSNTDLNAMTSIADTEELAAKITAAGKNPDDYIMTVSDGMYEDKDAYVAEGYACITLATPVVTKADAYSSAFAVTTDCDEQYYLRAMEIIYAINTDTYLRNLLQYGVKNTNYFLDENNCVTRILTSEDSIYTMDLKYTGDLFAAYYCEEYGYTNDVAVNGAHQNLDATYQE